VHTQEDDYLAFDAVRQAAQCVGRVIRSKSDYGEHRLGCVRSKPDYGCVQKHYGIVCVCA